MSRSDRVYGPDLRERLLLHLRLYTTRSLLTAIGVVALGAGIVSATPIGELPLIVYVAAAVVLFVVIFLAWAMRGPRFRLMALSVGTRRPVTGVGGGVPAYANLRGTRRDAPVAQIAAGRAVDHVYDSGFRALLDPGGDPIAIIASNPRDVARPGELPLTMFTERRGTDRTVVDLRPYAIPIDRYSFLRDLPASAQDTDHTLAVKDLIFLPELAAAFARAGIGGGRAPFVWPEHCVDPTMLGAHDLIVVGGPDTNFWHAALFEPVAQAFTTPPSTVPLAVSLREADERVARYSSRALQVRMAGVRSVIPEARGDTAILDERLYPTCAMILACSNPYAPTDRSRWCVFVAGTRSLGTSAAVLALSAVIGALHDEPELHLGSVVPTESPDVHAHVSALLCRVVEVEHASAVRDNSVVARGRRALPLGPDPYYSDTYVPTSVEVLANEGDAPRWLPLVELQAGGP